MQKNISLSKTFLAISLSYTIGILVWLLLTPSLSKDDLFLGAYTFEKFILICILGFLLLLELGGFFFSKRLCLDHLLHQVFASKIVFHFILFFTVILPFLVFGFVVNNDPSKTIFINRILPIISLFFLLVIQIFIFQILINKGKIWQTFESPIVTSASEYISSKGRDFRLDFLRGLLIVIMVVDHVSDKSYLYLITSGGKFFTSAAEGFFLISGLVTGLVYQKVIQRNGLFEGIKKSFKRLGTIYLITISLSFFILIINTIFSVYTESQYFINHSFDQVKNILLFVTQYDYSNILVVYTLFFLFLPLVLSLLYSRKTIWVCLISVLVYVIHLVFPNFHFLPFKSFMDFSGAQLFFVIGIVLGYHHVLEKIQKRINRKFLVISGGLFFVLVIIWSLITAQNKLPTIFISPDMSLHIQQFFDKANVGLGRFFASFVVFGFLYGLLTLKWQSSNRLFGWLFIPLGQNSLFAYSLHVIIIMVVKIISMFLQYDQTSSWLNAYIQLVAVLIIWYITTHKQVFTRWFKKEKVPG